MGTQSYQPKHGDTPNDTPSVSISQEDIPLHCPLERMRLWDSHPRVYLPLDENGEAMCPYCGTQFVLSDSDQAD